MNRVLSSIFTGSARSVTVKKNIVASLLIRGISIVISLALVPMTLGYVSSELYGIWLTLSSIMIWLSFFDIGFSLGLKNRLAEAIALKDWDKGRSLVSTTYFILLLIFTPICLILEICIPFVNWSRFLNVGEIYNAEITQTLHVLVGFFCIQMVINVLNAVTSAFQKTALSSAFPVIGNFLSLIAIWLLTKFCSPSLLGLAFAVSSMPVIVILTASIILYHSQFNIVAPSLRAVKMGYIKDLLGLGIRFFLIMIQVIIIYQSTNILISNVSGPEDVTSYNIAYKYMSMAMMLFTIVLTPLWPAFTDAYTKNDYKWMVNVYRKMSKFCLLSIGLMVCMLMVSPWFYKIWIGDKAIIPFTMTLTVCIYMMLYNWNSLHIHIINGIGAISIQTYISMFGMCIHIPLALYLGKHTGTGSLGVVMSMIIINVVYCFLYTIQVNKILRQKAAGIWLK